MDLKRGPNIFAADRCIQDEVCTGPRKGWLVGPKMRFATSCQTEFRMRFAPLDMRQAQKSIKRSATTEIDQEPKSKQSVGRDWMSTGVERATFDERFFLAVDGASNSCGSADRSARPEMLGKFDKN